MQDEIVQVKDIWLKTSVFDLKVAEDIFTLLTKKISNYSFNGDWRLAEVRIFEKS